MVRKTKTCSVCEKAVGWTNRSGLCPKHLKAKYYRDNLDKTRADMKRWRADNQEKCRELRMRRKQLKPDKVKAERQAYFESAKGRFAFGRRHARYRGIEWHLTLSEYEQLMSGASCTYCRGIIKSTGVGLDRIDNSLGYSIENVVPCCGSCNGIRNDFLSFDEMKFVMGALIEYRRNRAFVGTYS